MPSFPDPLLPGVVAPDRVPSMGHIFIIQRVKARAILCPHQPPTKGDNTVSVVQGDTMGQIKTKSGLLAWIG